MSFAGSRVLRLGSGLIVVLLIVVGVVVLMVAGGRCGCELVGFVEIVEIVAWWWWCVGGL